ncbi:DNA-directed RNA polymerase II subunit 4 [Rosa sericea]
MLRGEDEDASELKIGEDFLKAKCLMNSEVAILLEHRYDQMKQMSGDSTPLPQVLEKSLQYVKRFSRFTNQGSVKQVRDRYQLAEFELAVIGNLCPETVEEAKAIVPSLKIKGRGHDDEAVERLLNDLLMIKKFE